MMLATWKEIYDAFDGKMEGCTGIACSNTCCDQKEAPHRGRDGESVSYMTSFFNSEEYCSHPLCAGIPDSKIVVKFIDIGKERAFFKILVNNCLSLVSGCKLADSKPITCRIYPFSLSQFEPIRTECPHIVDILQDPAIVAIVYNIRRLIDFDRAGNLTWLHNANKARESILRTLDGERTLTYHVLEK